MELVSYCPDVVQSGSRSFIPLSRCIHLQVQTVWWLWQPKDKAASL